MNNWQQALRNWEWPAVQAHDEVWRIAIPLPFTDVVDAAYDAFPDPSLILIVEGRFNASYPTIVRYVLRGCIPFNGNWADLGEIRIRTQGDTCTLEVLDLPAFSRIPEIPCTDAGMHMWEGLRDLHSTTVRGALTRLATALPAAVPRIPNQQNTARAGRKRSYTPEQQRNIVAGWLKVQTEQKIENYCEEFNISPRTLQRWKKNKATINYVVIMS